MFTILKGVEFEMACPSNMTRIGSCDNTYTCSVGCQGFDDRYVHTWDRCIDSSGTTHCWYITSKWVDCCRLTPHS